MIPFFPGYRRTLLEALKPIQTSKKHGMFIDGCFHHCQASYNAFWSGPHAPHVNNKVSIYNPFLRLYCGLIVDTHVVPENCNLHSKICQVAFQSLSECWQVSFEWWEANVDDAIRDWVIVSVLRATLHHGQGPRPLNSEGPWNSSEGPYLELNCVSWAFNCSVKTCDQTIKYQILIHYHPIRVGPFHTNKL